VKAPVRVVAAGVFAILLTLSLFLIRSGSTSAPDYQTLSTVQGVEEKVIEIPAGSTGSEIAQILFDAGIIKSSQAYFRVAVGDARSEKVAPGRHRLTVKISAQQALDQLLDPTRIPNLIKVNEGMWKSEIQSALNSYGYSKAQIKDAFSQLQLPKGFSDSEGLLFPAQYSFAEGTPALEAVQEMVDRFSREPQAKELLKGSQEILTASVINHRLNCSSRGRYKGFHKGCTSCLQPIGNRYATSDGFNGSFHQEGSR